MLSASTVCSKLGTIVWMPFFEPGYYGFLLYSKLLYQRLVPTIQATPFQLMKLLITLFMPYGYG